MKVCFILMFLASFIFCSAEVLRLSDTAFLSLEAVSNKTLEKTLWLKEKEGKPIRVWPREEKQSLLGISFLKEEAVDLSIVAADRKESELAVLFKLKTYMDVGRDFNKNLFTAAINRTPARLLPGHYAYRSMAGDEYFILRSFIKGEEGWKPKVSLFINTLWTDTYFEEIDSVSIAGRCHYQVQFQNGWAIGDHYRKYRLKRKRKMLKSVFFDAKANLLFDLKVKKKRYVKNAYWWSGVAERKISPRSVEKHLQMLAQRAEKLQLKKYKAVYASGVDHFSDQYEALVGKIEERDCIVPEGMRLYEYEGDFYSLAGEKLSKEEYLKLLEKLKAKSHASKSESQVLLEKHGISFDRKFKGVKVPYKEFERLKKINKEKEKAYWIDLGY